MEFNKVNFQVIEDCFSSVGSKEAVYQVFMAAATNLLDSEIKVVKADSLPAALRTLPKKLGITNEKAIVLMLSLHALMKEYISNGMADEAAFNEHFPETFDKKIKTLLFKMMRQVAESTKNYYQDTFSSLPKMQDFDWRLDVKISSKQQDRLKQPTLYVKMDLEKQPQDVCGKQVLFQVSKGQLKEILSNFETINEQLGALTAAAPQE